MAPRSICWRACDKSFQECECCPWKVAMDGLGALGNRMMTGMRMRVPAANRSSPFCFGNERTRDSGHPLSQGPYLSLLIGCISVLSRTCALGRRPPALPLHLPPSPVQQADQVKKQVPQTFLYPFQNFLYLCPISHLSPSLPKKQTEQPRDSRTERIVRNPPEQDQ